MFIGAQLKVATRATHRSYFMKRISLIFLSLILFGCETRLSDAKPTQLATLPVATLETAEIEIKETTQFADGSSFYTTQRCPANRFVLGEYPDFSSEANLITLIDDKLAFVDIKEGRFETYDYVNVIDTSSLSVSPDGTRLSYVSGFGDDRKLWLFTPSTKEVPTSFAIPNDISFGRWISNSKIALWSFADPYGCYQYDSFFDLDTESVTQPSNRIPEMEQSRCIRLPSISSDGLKALYPWQVKDLDSGATYDIFIVDKIVTNPPNYFLGWSNNSVSIGSYQGNTLSYKINLSVNDLNSQPIKLQTVQMPGFATKDSLFRKSPVIEFNMKRFGWDLIDQNVDFSSYHPDAGQDNIPTNFYLVNLEMQQFVNYCLDRNIPISPEMKDFSIPEQRGYFSPDGRYLAWTIYSNVDYTPPIETQVLDLETGMVAVFKEVEVFGWIIP